MRESTRTETHQHPARQSRRLGLRAILASVTLIGTFAFIAPTHAGAWAWSPSVTLQGSSICAASATTWVWVEASNGEHGWATAGSGRYRFDFKHVPTSGVTVRANYGNSTFRCTDSFGLKRPAWGTSATRNLYKLVPNG